MRDWNGLMIHHSATRDGETYSWSAIERYHTQHNGWSDIGYHFGVEFVRDHFAVLVGRPLTEIGAHCRGRNSDTIGICFVGNYDAEAPRAQMIEVATRRLILPLMDLFDLDVGDVLYHRDYSTKTCPGRRFGSDLIPNAVRRLR